MIYAPNFTQIPNIFLDDMVKELGFAEMKVLLVIFRQTFGWHKTRDRISLSQFEEKTGLGRKHITKAIKSLLQKDLITKEVVGSKGDKKTYYELVVRENSNNSDQWPKATPPSGLKPPTKETTTKETLTPPTPPSSFASAHSSGVVSPQGEPTTQPPKKKTTQPKPEKKKHGEFVTLTDREYQDLEAKYGKEDLAYYIEIINSHTPNLAKPYKDYAAAIRTWWNRDHKPGTKKAAEAYTQEDFEENKKLAEKMERFYTHIQSQPEQIVIATNDPSKLPKTVSYKMSQERFKELIRR